MTCNFANLHRSQLILLFWAEAYCLCLCHMCETRQEAQTPILCNTQWTKIWQPSQMHPVDTSAKCKFLCDSILCTWPIVRYRIQWHHFFCVSLTFINDCSESYEKHERVLSACIWNSCSIFAYISSLEITTEGYITWQDHNQETPQIFYTHIYRYLQINAAGGKLKGMLSDVDCMTPHRRWLQVNSTSGRRS